MAKSTVPIRDMAAKELRYLAQHRCEHKHSYLEHLSCYRRDASLHEKIGFLDIETEALEADYGIIFTYCIKDNDSNTIYHDEINAKDIKKWGKEAKDDTRLLKSLIRDVGHFNRLVGHYSSRFDLSFIRTRAIMCGIKYPEYGAYLQADTWDILRRKFKLSRNSLESGTRNLLGKTRKNHLSLSLKNGCVRGEPWAIKETLEHNRRDVLDTQDLYRLIEPYARKTNSSF